MIVEIKLLSDAIFGSGRSVPGAEDISVLHDAYGFPYLSGTNLKGNLREAAENLFCWKNMDDRLVTDWFGVPDEAGIKGEQETQITVSDFLLPAEIRKAVLEEFEVNGVESAEEHRAEILELFSELRMFTALESGRTKDGSLRVARCLQKGLLFYGTIQCSKEQRKILPEVLGQIKWLGSMRSRGFGMVRIREVSA